MSMARLWRDQGSGMRPAIFSLQSTAGSRKASRLLHEFHARLENEYLVLSGNCSPDRMKWFSCVAVVINLSLLPQNA